jgi:T5SS/PEP-CTERM-associated repeat protein
MKLFFTGFLLASHLLAASLHAQFTLRIWNNPGTGDWFSPINWSGGVPISVDFAYIRNGGTAQITAPGANVRDIFLGDLGGVGRLRISGTGFLTAQESIWVGSDGIGEMVLSGGGRALSDGGVVGQSFGGNGAVTVTDPGSRWTLTGLLHVGLGGTGILDIRNNAVVLSNDDILLGHDGSGIVQVRDNGSSLEAAHLAVGFHGSAYLEISNGGYVNSSNSSMAVAGHGCRVPLGCGCSHDGQHFRPSREVADRKWRNGQHQRANPAAGGGNRIGK